MFLGGCTMIKRIRINKNKSKEKIKLFDMLGDVSVTRDVGLHSNIILKGNKTANVEGCKSIVEYTPNVIKLNLGKGYLTLNGNELNISLLDSDEVMVNGDIVSVEFC